MTTKFIDFLKKIQEEGEAPTNAVGGGKVAGLGVGTQGEPGRRAVLGKPIKRKMPQNVKK